MNTITRPRAAAKRHPRSALNWVDFLVIAATIMTFAVVVFANDPHSKKSMHSLLLKDTAVQTGQLQDDIAMMKARVRLAAGGPWS